MPITPKNTPSLNGSTPFDPAKGFSRVTHQRGKVYLATDHNDAQDIQNHASRAFTRAINGFEESPTVKGEWAVRPVSTRTIADVNGSSPRNNDNFGVTLGRLATHLGIIDTKVLLDSATSNTIIYDYQNIVDQTVTEAADRDYANHLFAGKATAVDGTLPTTRLIDADKLFHANHRLLETNLTVTVPGAATTGPDLEPQVAVESFRIVFTEPTCRLLFTTGLNAGEIRDIAAYTATSVTAASAFPFAIAEGDEYYILPGNALTAHREEYDAKTTVAATTPLAGLTGGQWSVYYVQSFEDDISASEDDSIRLVALDDEVSTRTQLRWCVRVTNFYMSSDDDAGYAALHPIHLRNVESSATTGIGEFPFRYELNTGVVPAYNAQLEGIYTTERWTRQLDTDAEFRFDDIGFGNYYGVTAAHSYLRNNVVGYSETLAYLPEFLQALMYRQFANADLDVSYSVLMAAVPDSKGTTTPALQTLNELWFPGVGTKAVGLIAPRLARSQLTPQFPWATGAVEGYTIVPQASGLSLKEVALELTLARAVGTGSYGLFNSTYGLLFTDDPDYRVPLLYPSFSAHIAASSYGLFSSLGLINTLGVTRSGDGEVGRGVNVSNFLPDAATYSAAQAGQSTLTYLWNTATMLNPLAEARGSVHMIDPLAGTATTLPDDFGKFVGGPAKYLLRDSDEEITPNHLQGWGFFKKSGTDYLNDNRLDFTPRNFHEGQAQAAALRQALNFKKLAIKTSAHKEMDMFNIRIPAWWKVVGPDNKLLDKWDPITGLSYTAVGGVQMSPANTPAPNTIAYDSYGLAGFDDTAAVGSSSYRTPLTHNSRDVQLVGVNFGADRNDSAPELPDARGSHAVEWYDEANAGSPPSFFGSASGGPWGRIVKRAYDGSDTSNPDDMFENRCTSMRMRYHIGDYYPGPLGENDVPTNALVDTLNLFVRIEQLPLVHWATMPRHQHPVLRASLDMLDGLALWSKYIKMFGSYSHLVDADWNPLVTVDSPAAEPDQAIGDISWTASPFPHAHQPFVHWYHPMQEYITAPHAPTTDYLSAAADFEKVVVYTKWGERSLVSPGPARLDVGALFSNATSTQPTRGNDANGGLNFSTSAAEVGGTSVSTHNTEPATVGADTGVIVQVDGDADVLHFHQGDVTFPFVPLDPDIETVTGTAKYQQMGVPGPVFIPAAQKYDGNFETVTPLIAAARLGYSRFFDRIATEFHNTAFDDAGRVETKYWPQKDAKDAVIVPDDVGNLDGGDYVLPSTYKTTPGNQKPWSNATFPGTPPSSFDWNIPVLRTHIRTDTVASIVRLTRTTLDLDTPVSYGWPQNGTVTGEVDIGDVGNYYPATGPSVTTDTVFVGSLGTSINTARLYGLFMSPLVLGMPSNVSGSFLDIGEAATLNSGNYNDIFDFCAAERQAAYQAVVDDAGDTTPFAPLLNTFANLQNAGLAYKLLMNSSFRVLHARPGGGFKSGTLTNNTVSGPVKSLTELFIVRNRITGAAVDPSFAGKPFLHVESMHPLNALTNSHPNYAKIGHLYPMISDSLGYSLDSTFATSLRNVNATDTRVDNADFTGSGNYGAAFNGDTFIADPFDAAAASKSSPDGNAYRFAPVTERLHQNSGIEIDLVSELRYVRENPAAHGLDVGIPAFDGSWLDQMPTVEDLTAPGDHEIIFVLYTGNFGQKMVDTSIAGEFNPPVCGAHVVASIEENRPNEKASSEANGSGKHYGENRNTWHILGHS